MNTTPSAEPLDRFFVARIDGKPVMFVLHADKSVCIAATTQPITSVEPAEMVLGELCGLAA